MSNTEPKGCLFAVLKVLGIAPNVGQENRAQSNVLPYRRKDYLLTKAERAFFDVLHPIVAKQLHLFAMVRLADLVYIERGIEKRQSYFNRIQSKHIDFVLCDRNDIKPILAIELDDSSHRRADRIARDEFVDNALAQAGLPLLRVPVRANYDPAELRNQIQDAIRKNAK